MCPQKNKKINVELISMQIYILSLFPCSFANKEFSTTSFLHLRTIILDAFFVAFEYFSILIHRHQQSHWWFRLYHALFTKTRSSFNLLHFSAELLCLNLHLTPSFSNIIPHPVFPSSVWNTAFPSSIWNIFFLCLCDFLNEDMFFF